MHAKIQKWGNSQGLRLTRNILDDARLGVGDEVNIEVRDGVIVIAPAIRIRGRYRLEDLVGQIPKNHLAGEVDWGKPVGKEAW
jgi:antitoxin MazE